MTLDTPEQRRDRDYRRLARDIQLLRHLADEIDLRMRKLHLEELQHRLQTTESCDG